MTINRYRKSIEKSLKENNLNNNKINNQANNTIIMIITNSSNNIPVRIQKLITKEASLKTITLTNPMLNQII